MSLLLLVVVLLVLFGAGGATYSRWGTGGPAWGGNVLYLLALVLVAVLIVRLVGGAPF